LLLLPRRPPPASPLFPYTTLFRSLCAGVTTFNALRHSGVFPGDLVAVQGIGGLGHLGIQFASKFGHKVVAIGRGSENAALAKKRSEERRVGKECRDRWWRDE